MHLFLRSRVRLWAVGTLYNVVERDLNLLEQPVNIGEPKKCRPLPPAFRVGEGAARGSAERCQQKIIGKQLGGSNINRQIQELSTILYHMSITTIGKFSSPT